jgi:hypothetical protein
MNTKVNRKIKYARYESKVECRIGKQYKDMLVELSESSKKTESEIIRDILESSIRRRHSKLNILELFSEGE